MGRTRLGPGRGRAFGPGQRYRVSVGSFFGIIFWVLKFYFLYLIMHISIGKKTDIGCVREINEDCCFVEVSRNPGAQSLNVLLVADGMGGQLGGEIASQTAVDTVKTLYLRNIRERQTTGDIGSFIISAFKEANHAVFEKGKSISAKIGTTLTAAFIKGATAYIGHIGDSRAYLIRERDMEQLTEDHTLAEDLVRKGKASNEEMKNSPMQNMLTRSIGSGEELIIDPPISVDLKSGDVLLLCTDGLTNLVEDREIISTIHNTPDVQAACDRLVDLAKERGGFDNITVVAAEFDKLKRIKGLGIRTKTISIRKRKRSRFLIIGISILAAILLVLIYLISFHSKEFIPTKKPPIKGEIGK